MESGAEVVRVVAAIVSAFHTAADILEQIRDRKDKKKRKRERDVEELLEMKILLRSLLEGESACRKHCENRQQQFSPAFENGDAIAVPALKDVVIALQTEVIQALHITRAVENAVLNFSSLLESSITCRKDATRVMDQLCQRITASAQFQPHNGGSAVVPSDTTSMLSCSTGHQPGDYDKTYEILPQTPAALSGIGNPNSNMYQRALSPLPQRSNTIRRPSDTISQHSRYRPAQAPTQQLQQPQPSPGSWPQRHVVTQLSSSYGHAPVSGPSSIADDDVSNHYTIDDQQIERMSITSIQDSVFALGGDRGGRMLQPVRNISVASRLHHTPSVSDMTGSDQSRQSSQRDQDTSDQSPKPLKWNQSQEKLASEQPPPQQHFEIFSEHPSASASLQQHFETVSEHPPASGLLQQLYEVISEQPTASHFAHQHFDIISEQSPVIHSPQATFSVRTEQHSRDEVVTVHLSPGRPRQPQSRVSSEGLRQQNGVLQAQPQHQPRQSSAPVAIFQPPQQHESGTRSRDFQIHNEATRPTPPRHEIEPRYEYSKTHNPGNGSPPPQQRERESQSNNFQIHTTTETQTQMPALLQVTRSPITTTEQQRPHISATINKPSDSFRSLDAPEVMPNDFEFSEKIAETKAEENEKYPAFLQQADYAERLKAFKKEQENVWLPLARPAMHNRYHGFCKGAWMIRRSVPDGLDVHVSGDLRNPTLHWQCKTCSFRSRAPNADALPDQILANQKYGIRYRWLFLAKSHRHADVASDSAETYKYGCVLCAAQGKTTAVYERLEHLMLHLVSKHKAAMLTPELKAKTKCIVAGGEGKPGDDDSGDWDLQLPSAGVKGVAAEEILMSARGFFGKRKKNG